MIVSVGRYRSKDHNLLLKMDFQSVNGTRFVSTSSDGTHLFGVGGGSDNTLWSWKATDESTTRTDSGSMRLDVDSEVKTGNTPKVRLSVSMFSAKETLPPFIPWCNYVQGRWKDIPAYFVNETAAQKTIELPLEDGASTTISHPEATGEYTVTLSKDTRGPINIS